MFLFLIGELDRMNDLCSVAAFFFIFLISKVNESGDYIIFCETFQPTNLAKSYYYVNFGRIFNF